MNADQHLWQEWVATIRRWQMQEWFASLLEAAGPLAILGAQVVYVTQPLLNVVWSEKQLEAVARLLEDTQQTRSFVELLREASNSEPV